AEALRTAGAAEVFTVGGAVADLVALGLDARPDLYPGQGPLGGLVTALAEAGGDLVAVLACDLVAPTPSAVRAIIGALEASPDADAALAFADGRRQWTHGAWRRRAATRLSAAFEAGERAIHRAAVGLRLVDVYGLDPRALADADTPGQLPGEPE
ncbi:MAG: molybdenum cofactor guanylyltransferase, partial [Acidimicrobiales bacterium]